MCVTLSCPLSRNLLSCVPTEVRLYPSRHSQSISGGGGSQVDAHAQRAWVPPAVGWLWPCGPQQLVLGGREGASLSPPLFVFVLLLHWLYQLSEGGWRSSSMAAVATAPTLPSPTWRAEWRQAGCGNKCLLGEWLWFLLGLQWHWESTLF